MNGTPHIGGMREMAMPPGGRVSSRRMSNHDLLRKLGGVPFKPFRLKLSNATAIDVTEPGSVIVGDTSAVLPVEVYTDAEGFRIVKNWKTIALSHVVEFSDLETKDRGPKRRKK